MPPIWVKSPPAYNSPAKGSRAYTVELAPLPTGCQVWALSVKVQQMPMSQGRERMGTR